MLVWCVICCIAVLYEMLYNCAVRCMRCYIAVLCCLCDVLSLYGAVCVMLHHCAVQCVRCFTVFSGV